MTRRRGAVFSLSVLFAINALNFFDRQILGAVAEPIREEWGLSDTALGWLATAFALIYAAVGLPFGRLTDKTNRPRILAGGVFAWSVLTAASGAAASYGQLFLYRLGVGVGEASCAPAATSLIGDLYPASSRARALAVFMLGLPVGVALSFAVSGSVAHAYGWRTAFYVAAIPGLICAALALWIRDPARGATERHNVGSRARPGSPYRVVLAIPTMCWIILSGTLHNFNMYTIGTFLAPFLQRYHRLDVRDAGFVAMVVYGLTGIPGLLIGGWAGDWVLRRRKNGRMIVGAAAMAIAAPATLFALSQDRGNIAAFMLWMGIGVGAMYAYYSTVYATIHDVVEPSLRGTAMALYFFAMYVLGASFGPVGTGFASDFFTARAAAAAGVIGATRQALEPFRAEGLHTAMYIIPALGVLLAVGLTVAARTVTADMQKLEDWMRGSAAEPPAAGTVPASPRQTAAGSPAIS